MGSALDIGYFRRTKAKGLGDVPELLNFVRAQGDRAQGDRAQGDDEHRGTTSTGGTPMKLCFSCIV